MPFVKLDTGLLDSTLWLERTQREVFITALLMAMPYEVTEPTPAIQVNSMDPTGFVVPPGWYGFVSAAGPGIVHRALVPQAEGLEALVALGEPEAASRSQDFEGRRLVRVDGGYVVLNYIKFRDRDTHAAARMKRWRDRQKTLAAAPSVTPLRDESYASQVTIAEGQSTDRQISQKAEAEGEGEERLAATPPSPSFGKVLQQLWNDGTPAPTFPRCVAITKTREEKCRLRLRERPVEEWAAAIRRLAASSFCRAQNDRGWVATFDWLIANSDNVVKVLEGKYDDRAAVLPDRSRTAGNSAAAAQAMAMIRGVAHDRR